MTVRQMSRIMLFAMAGFVASPLGASQGKGGSTSAYDGVWTATYEKDYTLSFEIKDRAVTTVSYDWLVTCGNVRQAGRTNSTYEKPIPVKGNELLILAGQNTQCGPVEVDVKGTLRSSSEVVGEIISAPKQEGVTAVPGKAAFTATRNGG